MTHVLLSLCSTFLARYHAASRMHVGGYLFGARLCHMMRGAMPAL